MRQTGSSLPSAAADAPATLPPSVIGRLLRVLRREPVLFVTLSYVLVSFLGLWSSDWFYRGLGLPILQYLQGGDLFIVGLRHPDYLLWLLAPLAIMWLSALPLAWAERHPQRAAAVRARYRWGAVMFPEPRSWLGLWGVRSDTLLVVSVFALALYHLYALNSATAARLVAGAADVGQPVQLTLAGSTAALPGDTRLLETTSAYVLVWWPGAGRVEGLPTANVARIVSGAPARAARTSTPAARPAAAAGA